MNGLLIRPYRKKDATKLARLFHRAVRKGTQAHYTKKKRDAWSPAVPKGDIWEERLSVPDTIVAERECDIVGFMTVNLENGYLDFAYVDPDVMGQGVAEVLYAVVEGRGRAAGLDRLETEASKLAERFFERRGWRVVAHQTVERLGVDIPNARMEKDLTARSEAAA